MQKPNNPSAKGDERSLDEYILQHIDAEGDYLHALWRDTQLRLSYGQMASGHLQGRVLKMLVEMAKPLKVLELGTFSGYATLCMAEGLQEGAEIHTGDALQLVPQMQERWDFAFIDADKREYVAYYEMLLPRMTPGGFIVADNTLWYGHVLEQPRDSDLQTKGVQAFNELVASDRRVEKVILPLRDGLTIIRVK